MRDFPATTTAYNLTTEYCTIQRVIQYQQSYDAKAAGINAIFDTRGYENLMYRIFHVMSDETQAISKEGSRYEKLSLANFLLTISNDERLKNFKVSAILMIEDFNKIVTGFPIPKSDAYDDFMKDGFVLSEHLLSNTEYALKNYFQKEVEKLNAAKNESELIIKEEKEIEDDPDSRIRFNLTSKEVVYLFNILKDSRIIVNANATDICKMIVRSFSYKKASGEKPASAKHLQNMWGQLDVQTAESWTKKFKTLLDKTKEDNPNNIKK